MQATGSIKKKGNCFMWSYQDSSKFLYGFTDTMEEAQISLEKAGRNDPTTVDDCFREFMSLKEKEVKPPTVVKYFLLYRTYLQPVLGQEDITSVTSMQIETLLTDMIRDTSISPLTTNIVKGMVSSLFKWAFRAHKIPRNPYLDVETPRNRKKPKARTAFTEKQLEEVLRRVEGTEYELQFKLGAWCGMRASEITSLQQSDIDFRKNIIRVRHSLEYVNGTFILNTPKTDSSVREIPVSKKHMLEIRAYMQSPEYLAKKEKAKGMKIKSGHGFGRAEGEAELSEFVFLTRAGKPFIGSSLSRKMKKIVDGMKAERKLDPDGNYVFHSLRHSFCSLCLQKGMSVRVVAALLGHSTCEQVYETYSHLFPGDTKKEMRKSGMLDGVDPL